MPLSRSLRECLGVAMLALAVVACAGAPSSGVDAASPTSSIARTPTTSASTVTTAARSTATAPETTRPAPDPDRPLAPQFTLTLGDGTVYRSADDVRPIYLVFWAEW